MKNNKDGTSNIIFERIQNKNIPNNNAIAIFEVFLLSSEEYGSKLNLRKINIDTFFIPSITKLKKIKKNKLLGIIMIYTFLKKSNIFYMYSKHFI